jgi:hypothetical protein
MDLAFFYMDEISSEQQWKSFLVLSPALTQSGFPQQGWVTSTPDWRKPWVKHVWIEKIHPDTEAPLPEPKNYEVFRAHQENNWHLPKGFVEEQKAIYGDTLWAQQELAGEFIAVEGAGFRNYRDEAPIVMNPPEHLDFGDVSPTALMELKRDTNNHVWVTREFYKANATDEEWTSAAGEWGLTKIICDPSGGHKRKERLTRLYGVSIDLAPHKEWDIRYRLFHDRPECVNLRKEIPNLAFAEASHGGLVGGGWMKGSIDHAWDATCYPLEVLDMGHAKLQDLKVKWSSG